MKDLAAEQLSALPWGPNEKFALVNKETLSIEFASDNEGWLRGVLQRMTPAHPRYSKLQLVARPDRVTSDNDKIVQS